MVRAALLLVLGSATPAAAHAWYDERCCSGRDCHPVACDQFSPAADGGVTFAPTGLHVFKENVLPSQDTRCHLCTSHPGLDTGYAYCAYLQQGF